MDPTDRRRADKNPGPARIPLIISADDHVVEPPDLWAERVPRRLRAAAPRVVRGRVGPGGDWNEGAADAGDPCDCWFFEDFRKPLDRMQGAVGFGRDELWKLTGGTADEDFGPAARQPLTYDELRPGCYKLGPRLEDMDLAGIERSLCFPNMFLRFCGQTLSQARDRVLGLACIRAYNDWIVEEWAAPSGGRLIPVCLVPLWDADLAAQEVRRNAERAVRAVTFSELPARLGLPSIHDPAGYWDSFFRACDETGTAICLHIGSGSDLPVPEPGGPRVARGILSVIPTTSSLVDYLFSGLFERFAGLKVVYSESQIGWIPYILERADLVWAKHVWGYDRARIPRPPSTYFADHVFASFIEDRHGIESLDRIGADNVMLECDYPHSDSSWPDTHRLASQQLSGLEASAIEKVVRANAIRVFELNEELS